MNPKTKSTIILNLPRRHPELVSARHPELVSGSHEINLKSPNKLQIKTSNNEIKNSNLLNTPKLKMITKKTPFSNINFTLKKPTTNNQTLTTNSYIAAAIKTVSFE